MSRLIYTVAELMRLAIGHAEAVQMACHLKQRGTQ